MTDPVEQLAAIKERVEKATLGPWTFEHEAYGDEWWFGGDSEGGQVVLSRGERTQIQENAMVYGGSDTADAEFIAHAREDIPLLLATIEEWHTEFAQLEEQVKMMADLEGDKWKANMLDATGTMLRLWFLEGVPKLKQDHRKERTRADKLENALQWVKGLLKEARSYPVGNRAHAVNLAVEYIDAVLATEAEKKQPIIVTDLSQQDEV